MWSERDNIITCLRRNAAFEDAAAGLTLLDADGRIKRSWNHRELLDSVVIMAGALQAYNLAGKRVLLFFQEVSDFLIAFLAVSFSGGIPIPMPFARSGKQLARLRNIVLDAKAAVLLCHPGFVPAFETQQDGFAGLYQTIPITPGSGELSPAPDLVETFNEIAFIQYTSGSTGAPKGVVVSQQNLMTNQEMIVRAFHCNRASVILSWLPFHHDMGLIGNLLHSLYVGCHCIVMSPFDFIQRPQRWLESISAYRVTHSGGPNFAFDLCVEKTPAAAVSGLDLSCWQVAFNGSEPIQGNTLDRFASHFMDAGFRPDAFYPCYGLAEATLFVTGAKVDGAVPVRRLAGEGARVQIGSGMPVDGVSVSIFSTDGQVPFYNGEEGEICLEGTSISSGYFDKDNSGLFHCQGDRKWLRTGDLGRLIDGQLFVSGRIKETIIIRGKNLYPADIEQIVSRCHPALEQNGVAIFGSETFGDEGLVIVAELKRNQVRTTDINGILHSIDLCLKGHFGIDPSDILLTKPLAIPRTTSGKLQRLTCRLLYLQDEIKTLGSKRNRTAIAELSGNGLEETLAAGLQSQVGHAQIKAYLTQMILARTGISPDVLQAGHTELTDLGLDSLRGMELVNTINKQLQINLDVTAVLRDNSLDGLIMLLENVLWLKTSVRSDKEIVI